MLPDEMRRRVCWDDILLAMGMDEGQDDHMRRRKNIRSAQCEEMGSRSGRDRAEMLLDGQIALMSMDGRYRPSQPTPPDHANALAWFRSAVTLILAFRLDGDTKGYPLSITNPAEPA